MKAISTTLLLLLCMASYAQNRGYLESAYVVTYQRDTIWGEYAGSSIGKYFNSIKMKDPRGIKTKYREDRIVAAGFIEPDSDVPAGFEPPIWRQFEKIANPSDLSDSLIIEKIAYGPRMRLFVDPITTQVPKFTIRNIGFSVGTYGSGISIDLGAHKEPLQSFIIIKGKNQPIFITPKNFSRLYFVLFNDCNEFMTFINNHPEYKRFEELPNLVSEYNRCCSYVR